MVYLIAQLSDVHVGGPHPGGGERLSAAIAEINAMRRQPDLVLFTGDNTHHGANAEWEEFTDRLAALDPPWEAINGNHDLGVAALVGNRSITAGPLRLVLIDSSTEEFTADDAQWLDAQLAAHPSVDTVVAIHHPPFETGIWWMDCAGLAGADSFEQIVRRHPQVIQVLCGHVHRVIHTTWDRCSLWVSPSTSVAIAGDLHPEHDPAVTAEPPAFSLHAYTRKGIVSHVIPVGPSAARTPIAATAPDFVRWARSVQAERKSLFE